MIEYSAAGEKATLTLRYNGAPCDILQTGEALHLAVLKGIASRMEYSTVESENYVNQIIIEL